MRTPKTITDWHRDVARWYGVPVSMLLGVETVVPFWDKESVIPHRYNEGVEMIVTDAMVQAYAEAWQAQNEKPGNEIGARRRAGLMAALESLANEPGVVLMTREVAESMAEDVKKLRALESMGVDNWSGYDHAMREMREEDEAAEDEAQMFRPKS